MYLVTEDIKWTHFLPTPFAAYFYTGTGSLFPFFPWAGYVICGAILGSYLAHNPEAFTTKIFSYKLLITGVSILGLAGIFELIESSFYDGNAIWTDKMFIISLRVGGVIVLNGIMSLIALKLKSIPDLVKQIGRHTLLIYAVHVVIIYGSAWVPGIDLLLHRQMNIMQSVFSAITMIILMVTMVIMLEKYKSWKKNRLAPAEI